MRDISDLKIYIANKKMEPILMNSLVKLDKIQNSLLCTVLNPTCLSFLTSFSISNTLLLSGTGSSGERIYHQIPPINQVKDIHALI
jgi:hypothetical protein